MAALVPLELDYLVDSLRNPAPNTTVRIVLSYLYNYVPFVKHEHNLKVVFSSFLNSPVCFGDVPPSFEDNYLVIEAIKLIFDKKLKISRPTLDVRAFYEVILKELNSFVAFDIVKNSWKALAILTGISMSSELRDDLYVSNSFRYVSCFRSFDRASDKLYRKCLHNTLLFETAKSEVIDFALLTLGLKLKSSDNVTKYLDGPQQEVVISQLVTLLYGPVHSNRKYMAFTDPRATDRDIDGIFSSPEMKHLNKISVLLEKLFAGLSYKPQACEVILRSLSAILKYNQDLNQFIQAQNQLDCDPDTVAERDARSMKLWLFLKSILFSEVLIFQGIITRFLKSRQIENFKQLAFPLSYTSQVEIDYSEICYRVLYCLYYLNFVLTSIGQGGFDGYNFVYYVSLELCCKNNRDSRFQTFSRQLIGNYEVNIHHIALNHSFVSRCKVLFALRLFEAYFQQKMLNDTAYEAFIYDIAFDLTENTFLQDRNVTEAGHSVLLAYFSSVSNDQEGVVRVLRYFEVLLGQFPSRISPIQLNVAVETLGKKIMSSPILYRKGAYKDLIDQFLQVLYSKCTNTANGVSIPSNKKALFVAAAAIQNTNAISTVSQMQELGNTSIVKEDKKKEMKDRPVVNLLLLNSEKSDELFAVRSSPETIREGFIVAFLSVIPYLPLTIFEQWLLKLWALILASNGTERDFLIDKLWTILSENLDLNRCEIAYEWWYEKKHNVEHMDFGDAKL